MAKKLGMALGSGAARGWAHIGVLEGLAEMGVKPDVIAGCSVGALVGGAHLIGALDDFEAWARELKPLSMFGAFGLKVSSGGLIDSGPAFEAFRDYDQAIEDLDVKFGAVATDLGDGAEIWLTEGSMIDAVRASSAIPVVFHAVRRGDRWLVDGAVSNPVPTALARHLGADVTIAVNLNAVPVVIERFDPPPPSPPVLRTEPALPAIPPADEANVGEVLSATVQRFIEDTRRRIDEQLMLSKARADAQPRLFETAYAAADIFQMHLAEARARLDPPDIALKPDMRAAFPASFENADDFVAEGKRALLEKRAEIEALLSE